MEPNNEAILTTLSRSLRPAMSLPSLGVSEPISETLATFADRRHRIGPLLHLACQGSADIAVDKRLCQMKDLFRETLAASEIGRPTLPLKSFIFSGTADFIFPGKIGLLNSLFTRLMTSLVIRI